MNAPVRLPIRQAQDDDRSPTAMAGLAQAISALVTEAVEEGVARVLALQDQPANSRVPHLLLKFDEAAEALGCGKNKIYDLIKAGELDIVPIGRDRRVPIDSLRAYVSRSSTRHPAP